MNPSPATVQALLFTPDIGILVLTLSLLLIFFELNCPGSIIPGALGVLGVLLAVNSFRQWPISLPALLLLLAATLLCFWQVRHTTSMGWGLVCALTFSCGFAFLIAPPTSQQVHLPVAVVCGTLLGGSASALARIAHRARRNKGVN